MQNSEAFSSFTVDAAFFGKTPKISWISLFSGHSGCRLSERFHLHPRNPSSTRKVLAAAVGGDEGGHGIELVGRSQYSRCLKS